MQALHISRLGKWFSGRDKVRAVDDVTLDVQAGELLVLLGPSGCGKTTLLRCVAGLEDAQQGAISLGEQKVFDAAIKLNLPAHKRDIGMVFQNYSLWPHMTVHANVAYPLRARGFAAADRERRVPEVLRVVQCEHLALRLPSTLSGGQQQRIALARALASGPAIMLLDEPLSNLDALLREELRSQLRAIHRRLGFTGIYVTHDQTEAFTIGTQVAVMNAGRIEQLGSADDVYNRPATEYIARFLGIANSLAASYEANAWTSAAGPLDGDPGLFGTQHRSLTLYVRAEDVALSAPTAQQVPAAGRLRLRGGRIVEAAQVGNEVNYVIKVRESGFRARLPAGDVRFGPDDAVDIEVDHRRVLAYAEGRLVLPRT